MTFADLKTEVELLVKDPDYFERIPAYINAALMRVGSLVNFPTLKCIETVATIPSQMFTPVSSTHFGHILKVISDDIIVYPTLDEMLTQMSVTNTSLLTEEGPVEAVALEGLNLWYWPTPATAQTITFIGYLNPPALVHDDEVPSIIPEHLQIQLLAHGAAFYCYSKMEDGIDEQVKPNTTWHSDEFTKGISELHSILGRSRNHNITSVWRV